MPPDLLEKAATVVEDLWFDDQDFRKAGFDDAHCYAFLSIKDIKYCP